MDAAPGLGIAHVGEVLAALTLVVVAIVAVSWLMRRMNGLNLHGNFGMRILAAMPLGQRERVVLVEIGGTQLLLGVTVNGINRLHEFDPPLDFKQRSAGTIEFAARLRQAMRGSEAE